MPSLKLRHGTSVPFSQEVHSDDAYLKPSAIRIRRLAIRQPCNGEAVLPGGNSKEAHSEGGEGGWKTFRHSYRWWLEETEAPIGVQRELMRHASIQTTMNVWEGNDRQQEAGTQ
jgi:integrase